TAIDQMTKDFRQAMRIGDFKSNKVVLEFGTNRPSIHYNYSKDEGKLDRHEMGKNGSKRTLLTGCKRLTFSIYQRTPVLNTYDQYPAATNTECKVVAINWVASRTLLGSRANREEVQSAKVV